MDQRKSSDANPSFRHGALHLLDCAAHWHAFKTGDGQVRIQVIERAKETAQEKNQLSGAPLTPRPPARGPCIWANDMCSSDFVSLISRVRVCDFPNRFASARIDDRCILCFRALLIDSVDPRHVPQTSDVSGFLGELAEGTPVVEPNFGPAHWTKGG